MRRPYIDVARGMAVLLMIEAHTVDAWTRDADRASIAFRDARILGGFAAPLFLWLAGLSMALSAAAIVRRTNSRRAAVESMCARGLEIFILAFLFRVQAFVLSPGGELLTLFRVDILNIMGPALVLAGLAWGLAKTPSRQALWFAAIAAAVGVLTPIVRTAGAVNGLPAIVQWYLRPAGSQTTFVMFPWAGFVFAGAAAGVLLAAEYDDRRLQGAFAVAGATLVAAGFYAATLPSPYRESSFWTSSPAYFAIRIGIVMAAVSATRALQATSSFRGFASGWQKPLAQLGRSSLFVYWIHVELVYGYATWPLHGRLPLWGALGACGVFSGLMYLAAVAKDHVRQWRLAGGASGRPSTGLKEAT
jgi:uncharacterized membrane protein